MTGSCHQTTMKAVERQHLKGVYLCTKKFLYFCHQTTTKAVERQHLKGVYLCTKKFLYMNYRHALRITAFQNPQFVQSSSSTVPRNAENYGTVSNLSRHTTKLIHDLRVTTKLCLSKCASLARIFFVQDQAPESLIKLYILNRVRGEVIHFLSRNFLSRIIVPFEDSELRNTILWLLLVLYWVSMGS